MPAPIGSVVLNYKARKLTATIPPTYMDFGRVPATIESTLNSILGKYGYSAVWGNQLPEKLLAVRSGLARYGRNNISYVKGLGSFAFLSSYYSDMPCAEEMLGRGAKDGSLQQLHQMRWTTALPARYGRTGASSMPSGA